MISHLLAIINQTRYLSSFIGFECFIDGQLAACSHSPADLLRGLHPLPNLWMSDASSSRMRSQQLGESVGDGLGHGVVLHLQA